MGVRWLPILAILVLLFPATLGAVLPELQPIDIRRAMVIARARGGDSWLEKYRRTYPFRVQQSVEKIELTTAFTRMVDRARTQNGMGNYYTEYQAKRDYREVDHESVEVIAWISISLPFRITYTIQLFYTDRQGQPVRRSYSGGQILRDCVRGGDETRCYTEGLKVLLPLGEIDPASDLAVVVIEPDGHSTTAVFDLSELP